MKDNKEKELKAVKLLGDINLALKMSRLALILMCGITVVVAVGSVIAANVRVEKSTDHIYIIDAGSVLTASRADNKAQRDLEVKDHIRRFHELFYNLSPNVTSINQNVSRALELADESAYSYFLDLKEQSYYTRLVDINAFQEIEIDSMKVNVLEYPYKASLYASLYVMRQSTISLYNIETTCDILEAQRTEDNPHGLMITKFYATKPKFIGTQNRN